MTSRPVAVVTAASAGIGAGIARALAPTHELILLSRSEHILSIADELGATAVQGSLMDASVHDEPITTALDRWGRIDALAINSEHPPKGDLLSDAASFVTGRNLVVDGGMVDTP